MPNSSRQSASPLRRRPLLLLLALLLLASPAAAQAEGLLQAKIKATYIFKLIPFVDWPSLEAAGPAEPIRVGIVGRDAVADCLGELHGHSVRGRTLLVERYPASFSGPLACHILYICPGESQRLPQLLQMAAPASVLTVSDIPRFPSRGGMVGFADERGRVRIEINLRIARQSSLRISAKLLEVATVYQ